MAWHDEITAADCHAPWFVGTTDPALDADNHVTAGKGWVDTTSGFVLKKRDAANTGWDTIIDAAGKQPLDADLTAIAALTSAADKLPYATGAQAWALTTLTAFMRTLLDDVDAAAARATLGVDAAGSATVADGDKGDVVVSSTGTVWTIDSGAVTASKASNNLRDTNIPFLIGVPGGTALTTGLKGYVQAGFSGTITAATIASDQAAGSAVVDIWKDVHANFPPTVADTITASAKPTLSAAQKATDSTLTGWGAGLTITKGDWLAYNIDSISGAIGFLAVVLDVRKS